MNAEQCGVFVDHISNVKFIIFLLVNGMNSAQKKSYTPHSQLPTIIQQQMPPGHNVHFLFWILLVKS